MIGGVETHLTILMPELVKKGHSVSLLTGSAEGCSEEEEYRHVKIFRTPIMDLNWLGKRGLVGIENEFEKVCRNFINRVKPDIIHTHNMNYFSKPHATVLNSLSKEKGIPLILTAHNAWDRALFLDLTANINWRHIIAVSHYIKLEIIGIGYDDKKVTVVHHGIDTNKFYPHSKEKIINKYPQLKGRRVIFHPARMGLAKGCDVSVKAMKYVKEVIPDAMLVLAGTKNIIDWESSQQKDIAYILYLIDVFGLKESTLINVYTLEEMRSLYAIADVCIYPSSNSEPFGLTMLESLASAKPIIVTNSGGMPEVIRDGVNGFVVNVRDYEALGSRIVQILLNDRLRERLGYTGKEIVENSFTKEIMTKNTLKVYEKVLNNA
jgi:glycosyltransferase involved in cell wall biosynthesis